MLLQHLFKFDFLTSGFVFKRFLNSEQEFNKLLETYKLRYEIYCLECHYLSEKDCCECAESDEYDNCSVHFATYTLKDNKILGTVRLVQPDNEQMYPFQQHCQVFETFSPPPRAQTAEVSRLAIKKSYRSRNQGNQKQLILGLYKEMYRHSRQNGIRYWYVAIEDFLAQSMQKIGFKIVPIGPQADYSGPVTPYLADLDEVIACLRSINPFLAHWFNDEPIPIGLWAKTLFAFLTHGRFQKKRHLSTSISTTGRL